MERIFEYENEEKDGRLLADRFNNGDVLVSAKECGTEVYVVLPRDKDEALAGALARRDFRPANPPTEAATKGGAQKPDTSQRKGENDEDEDDEPSAHGHFPYPRCGHVLGGHRCELGVLHEGQHATHWADGESDEPPTEAATKGGAPEPGSATVEVDVQRIGSGQWWRILVPLGGQETAVTVEHARALSRALDLAVDMADHVVAGPARYPIEPAPEPPAAPLEPEPARWRTMGRVVAVCDKRAYCVFPMAGYGVAWGLPAEQLGPGAGPGYRFHCTIALPFDFEQPQATDLAPADFELPAPAAAAPLPSPPAHDGEPTDDEQRTHALDLLTWAVDAASRGRVSDDDARRLWWAYEWLRNEDAPAAAAPQGAGPTVEQRHELTVAAMTYARAFDEVSAGPSEETARDALAAFRRLEGAARKYAAPSAPQGAEQEARAALAAEGFDDASMSLAALVADMAADRRARLLAEDEDEDLERFPDGIDRNPTAWNGKRAGDEPEPSLSCGVVGCTDPVVWTKQTGSFLHCRCATHLREDYPSEAHAMGLGKESGHG